MDNHPHTSSHRSRPTRQSELGSGCQSRLLPWQRRLDPDSFYPLPLASFQF